MLFQKSLYGIQNLRFTLFIKKIFKIVFQNVKLLLNKAFPSNLYKICIL